MTGPLFPENYSKIWIRGRFITMAGVAVRGKLTLAPTVTNGGLVNRSLKLIMSAASFSADTDNDGYVALQVPATNDPDITPINFTYSVTTPIGQKFSIVVPYDTTPLNSVGDPLHGQPVIELIDVVPVGSSGGVGQLLRGIGIQSIVDNGAGGLLITYSDGATSTVAMPDTVTGPAGPAGPAGPLGPVGPVGPAGVLVDGQPADQIDIDTSPIGLADLHDVSTAGATLGQLLAPTAVAGGEVTAWGLASPVSVGTRSRRVWSIGDSLTAGNLTADAVMGGIGQGGIQYQPGSWQTWALLASGARWTHAGAFATGGYTAAQILATHVPAVLAASQPGDTVVVLAGTNGNVLADAQAIHAALRAAGRHTVACTIPPSTASTLSAIAAFNSGLKSWAGTNGVPLADVHAVVVDTATGAYQTVFNGDGVHPNEAGYRQFGYTIAAALAQVFPLAQADLVAHNAAFTGQLQPKPLALNSPTVGTDYNNLAPLGTSTFAPAANAAFVGGQGYKIVRGDTDVNARLANMTFVAGHRMRVGMAFEVVAGTTPTWSMRLESATTGQKALWGIGFPTAATLGQAASRFYSTFTVPTLPDYSYRLRIFVTGVGTTLHVGEVTMLDLTAMGLA